VRHEVSDRPHRLKIGRLLVAWLVGAASVYVAAGLVPGFRLDRPGSALVVAAAVAALNAVLPPLLAALRLPYTFVLGFLLVLGGSMPWRSRWRTTSCRTSALLTRSQALCWRRSSWPPPRSCSR
jgi:uncharacterized membrane protein YvlD (DUF360 family)